MKILIDDFRSFLPDGTTPDIIARSYEAGELMIDILDVDDELYIDHDLGAEVGTGYDLLTKLETLVHDEEREYSLPAKIVVVSDNGPGRQRLQLVADKLYGRLG